MICLLPVCICDVCGGVAQREDFVMPKKEGEWVGMHVCKACKHPEWTDEMEATARAGALQ